MQHLDHRLRTRCLLSLLLGTSLGLCLAPTTPLAADVPAAAVDGRSLVSPGPLRLNDADFWLDPLRTRQDIERPLMSANSEAIFLDAPQLVAIDVQTRAPVQLMRVAKLATLRQWPFRVNAVVVGVDLENNVVQAAAALAPPTRTVLAPAVPSAPAQTGMGSEAFTIDLRERLNLPWEAGRFLVRLVLADQITEARHIAFRTAVAPVDAEVDRFKREQRNKTRVPALLPEPGGPWVSYLRDDKIPALPEGQGIVVSLPRLCVLDTQLPCLLRGSFRLPVLKRHIVPTAANSPGAEALRQQWSGDWARGQRLPSAVVPITLVGKGTQLGTLMVWRLVVPIFDTIDFSGVRPMGVGLFSIDLRHLEGFAGVEQSWFIYAFSDESMSGPMTVGVTRRPRTP